MKYRDEDWLRTKYLEEDLTQQEIADICGVTKQTINNWTTKFGFSKDSWNSGESNPVYGGHDEETRRKISEARRGHSHSKETREKISESQLGENNHRWNPDATGYYGKDWDSVRSDVIERDEVCQLCEHDGSEHRMDVHHIEPLHTFESPEEANTLDNLILLCWPCHRDVEYHDRKI